MKNRIRKSLLIFLSLYLFLSFQLLSGNPTKPSKDDCLVCHSDKDISKVEKGKTISLWVNQSQLAHSVHGRMLCVDCHKDFNPDDIPHKENIQPPECFSCHKDFAKKHTFHPQMAFFTPGSNSVLFDCKKCHGTHGVSKPALTLSKPGATNAVEFCGSCHKGQKEQHIKSEHYAAYLKNNPNAPTCTYCHSKPITKYWIKDEIQLKEKQQQLCLGCHNDMKNGIGMGLKTIDFKNSNHGKAYTKGRKETASCIDCHGIHNIMNSDSVNSKINLFKVPLLCKKCHISIAQEFLTTAHGMALTMGNKDAPACLTCHNEHHADKIPEYNNENLKKNQLNADILIKNKMIFCVICHSNDEFQKRNHLKTIEQAHSFLPNRDLYMQDVRCVECHSANSSAYNMPHNILPQSKAIKKCTECHKDDAWLLTRLSKFEKIKAKKEMGIIRGTILTDGGLTRSTFNLLYDSLSIIIFAALIVLLLIHSFLRWYFKRSGGKK